MIDGHKVWKSFCNIIEEIFDIHVVISEDNGNVFLHPWYPMRSTDKFLRKNIYKSVFLSTAQSLRIQMYCRLTPSTSFISDYMRVVMVWQNVCLYRQLHHFNASDSWCACLQSQAYLDHRAPILWHLFHTLSWWSLWRYAAMFQWIWWCIKRVSIVSIVKHHLMRNVASHLMLGHRRYQECNV